MRFLSCLIVLLGMDCLHLAASDLKDVTLKLVETSDVHGYYYPYDFIRRKQLKGSRAHVSSYVKDLRATCWDNLILLDSGASLGGQPDASYSN